METDVMRYPPLKKSNLALLLAAALLNASAETGLRAADKSTPTPVAPNREELREKLKNLTPEERRAAIQEWREQHPEAAVGRKDLQKRREEFRNLTPEEREAKISERRAVAETKAAELRKKKAEGTITAQESQRLERMERLLKAGPRSNGRSGSKGTEKSSEAAEPVSGK